MNVRAKSRRALSDIAAYRLKQVFMGFASPGLDCL